MKRNNIISIIITLLVLIIVGAVVLPQFASYDSVLETIRTLTKSDVAIILGFTAVNIMVYAWPFMAATLGIRYWPAFLIRQTSFLLSNAFPGGGAIGVGVQYTMAATYGVKGAVASSGILSTSIWNMLATISLPGISLLLVWITGQRSGSNPVIGFLGILAAVVSIGGFVLIMRNEKLALRIAQWIETYYIKLRKKFTFLPKLVVTSSLLDFRKATYETTTSRWPLLAISNLAQQVAQYAVLYVILILLESDPVSIALTFAAFSFARIGTFIPLTPGGLGTVDAILISLLVQAGITSETAAAATLLWRATTYFPQLFIGVCTFLFWRFTSIKK
jgi:uncharacterized protein (TIRG00374 family)